ncbi:MAG: hypothetical protein PHD95_02965 [Candidatus ainarchaeum sp.]|nr:hypothetical protein [Candidatus ainarchaeum sp.]
MGLAEKFMRVYANLPLNIRKEIVLVINNEPITWSVAYREISGKTALGEIILKKLGDLKII